MTDPYWPLFDLRVRTPRLELRLGSEKDLHDLAAVAAGGIHDPGFMPFATAWSRKPSPELERGVLQWHWQARAGWSPERWNLTLVVHEGEVIGTQDLSAEHFTQLRSVVTGSWLGRRWQGRGLGKEMRAAVLQLAFEALGAEEAATNAHESNGPSLGVTRALGYVDNGTQTCLVEGVATRQLNFRLTRERWAEVARDLYPVSVEGVAACGEMFGLTAPARDAG